MIAVLLGTGTEVGKTTIAAAWLRSAAGRARGWKPVETGGDSDQRKLAEACGHLLPAEWTLPEPVSPHRAARLAGVEIDLEALAGKAARLASATGLLIVETAGGMLTPLTDAGATNTELTALLGPERVILVARDRLGVLHDVGACLRVAHAMNLAIDLVVLTQDRRAATSGLENAAELERLHRVPVLRGDLDETDRLGDELCTRFGPR